MPKFNPTADSFSQGSATAETAGTAGQGDSVFNPEQFISTVVDSAGSTQYFPSPVGDWPGQVTRIDGRRIASKQEKTLGQEYTLLEVTWELLSEEVRKATDLLHPSARQSLFLDLTPSGGLDFGRNKNVPLSRLREAVGQNKSGRPWAPSHLMGQTALVHVEHDVNKDTGEPRAIVTRVAKS